MKQDSGNKIVAQNLSLPKGGGGISGLSEKSSVREFDGSFSSAIAIPISKCRDITPSLSLSYNSASGNSEFGLGWDLNLSKISRKTSKGIPQYGASDTFLLDSQDLIPTTNGTGTETVDGVSYNYTQYSLRQEGAFSLIKNYYNSTNSFWKIIDRNHNVIIYGVSDEAKIYDLNSASHIFSWMVEEFYNDKGDHQIFCYEREDSTNISVPVRGLTNTYIAKIMYGCDVQLADSMILTNNAVLQDPTKWHFELVFDYGQYNVAPSNNNPYKPGLVGWACRPDPFSSYLSSFEIRTYRLCQNILMFHRFTELGENPILTDVLALTYSQNYVGISELATVTKVGYKYNGSAYVTALTPSTKFSYANFNPQTSQFLPLTTEKPSDITALDEVENYYFVDLFSEGVAGILYNGDGGSYYARPDLPNYIGYNASAEIAPLYVNPDLPASSIKYTNWQALQSFPNANVINVTDISGTGQVDLMISENNINGFWEANLDQSFNKFQSFLTFPSDFNAEQQRFVDITGNGLNDLVQLNNQKIKFYPSLGAQGFAKAQIVNVSAAGFPSSLESSEQKFIDFVNIDGSGTSHLVVVTVNSVIYFPNLGYGNFGAAVTMASPPKFDSTFNTKNLFFADLDGSGAADLIYFSSKAITIYFNCNGNGFSAPITLNLPTNFLYDDFVKINFADINGRGNSCLIMSDRKPRSSSRHLYYDFCNGVKPYLLNVIDNSFGATTTIDYCSSVDFYLADKKAGLTQFVTPPFPVHVAYQVTSCDEISDSQYVKQYAYHHGYYDGFEREFRGFGRVDCQDAQYFSNNGGQNNTQYSAPALTRSWYNIGILDLQQIFSNKFAAEYFSGDGQAFDFPIDVINWGVFTQNNNDLRLAYIAMAGELVHKEIYGLDDSVIMQNPYAVSHVNYTVDLLQPQGNNLYAEFLKNSQRSINYNYERAPLDPVISETVILTFDAYYNVATSCKIFYPRRNVDGAIAAQQNLRMTYSVDNYSNTNTEDGYLLGVLTESKSYEITQLSSVTIPAKGFSFDAINTLINSSISDGNSNLLNWEQFLYAQIDSVTGKNTVLNLGYAAIPLLPARVLVAEFPDSLVSNVFSSLFNESDLIDQLEMANYYRDSVTKYWFGYGLTAQYLAPDDFYLLGATYDPKNNTTSYAYDSYNLLLTTVTDPLNNQSVISDIDYSILNGTKITDPNGNVSQASFDALKRVVCTVYYGSEEGKAVGFTDPISPPDTTDATIEIVLEYAAKYLGNMQAFYFYDEFAWVNRQEPAQVLTIAATNYTTTTPAVTPAMEIALAYVDGFGRVQQSKTFVENGPAFQYNGTAIVQIPNSTNRWLTSGYTVYDNKGAVVEQYEPYYFDSPKYVNNELLNSFGFTAINSYDPLGRQTQTITPKGFLTKHEWSSWGEQIFDENDSLIYSPYYIANAEQIDPTSPYYDPVFQNNLQLQEVLAEIAEYFCNTFNSNVFDNLGNVIIENKINLSVANPLPVTLSTYHNYDILGRITSSCDPRLYELNKNNNNFTVIYGLRQSLQTVSVDSGTTWTLTDSMGNMTYNANNRYVQQFISYDQLNRISSIVATSNTAANDPLSINQTVENRIYGDTPGAITNPQYYNLRGKIYKHYDSAGLLQFNSYDILGNSNNVSRTFLVDYKDEVSWSKGPLLQNVSYSNSSTYDALSRLVQEVDVDGNITNISYYQSGRLNLATVTTKDDGKISDYFSSIIYNAKNQRESIKYGNGSSTTYSYDPKTWEVLNIVTQSGDNEVQNLQYLFDPVGNVVQKTDATLEVSFYANQKITPQCNYKYDAIYQLIQAQGYEQIAANTGKSLSSKLRKILSGIMPRATDSQALENYTENYTYDIGGNLTQVQHQSSSSWTTNLTVSNATNRATNNELNSDSTKVDGFFNAIGNQLDTMQANPLNWNYCGNISYAVTVKRENGNDDGEYYVYDSSGNRVRKVLQQYGLDGETLTINQVYYLDGIEIRQTLNSASVVTEEYHALKINDGNNTVATRNLWITGSPPSGFSGNIITFYHLSDILKSQTIELDTAGTVISSEEFSPYGNSTIFNGSGGANQLKVKRYCNKEKDVTGFYYYGMRYYSPTDCRWLSADPAGVIDGLNLYAFVGGNPVTFADANGTTRGGRGGKKVGVGRNPTPRRAKAVPKAEEAKKTKKRAPPVAPVVADSDGDDADDETGSGSDDDCKERGKKRGKAAGAAEMRDFLSASLTEGGKSKLVNTYKAYRADVAVGRVDAPVKPRKMAAQESVVRHLSTALLHMNKKRVEVQAAVSKATRTIYVASNVDTGGELRDFVHGKKLSDVAAAVVIGGSGAGERVTRHITSLKDTTGSDLTKYGDFTIEYVGGRRGAHAETKIADSKDFDFIGGTKRPCTCCTLFMHIKAIDQAKFGQRHGAYWATEASCLSLSGIAEASVSAVLDKITNKFYHNDNLSGKCGLGYGTDSC